MCSRDCKKFGAAAGAASVLMAALEALVHHLLLGPVYAKPHYAALWNPPVVMSSRSPLFFVAFAIFGTLFAKVYTVGYEDAKPPVGQGIRYGLCIGLMMAAYHALTSYVVYPVSWKLAAAWGAAGVVECVLMGIVVSLLYRPAPEAADHTH